MTEGADRFLVMAILRDPDGAGEMETGNILGGGCGDLVYTSYQVTPRSDENVVNLSSHIKSTEKPPIFRVRSG